MEDIVVYELFPAFVVITKEDHFLMSTSDKALVLLSSFLDNPCIEETDVQVKENLSAILQDVNNLNYEKFGLEDRIRELDLQLEELYSEYNKEDTRLRTIYASK